LIHSPLSAVFLDIKISTLPIHDFSIKLGDAVVISIAYVCLAASAKSIAVFITKSQNEVIFLSLLFLLVNLEDGVRRWDIIGVSQEDISHFFELWCS
jgi:hypothetical protein